MKKFRIVIVCALVVNSFACSTRRTREENYWPSDKTIELKSETPINEKWDRWSDSISYEVSGHIIAQQYLPNILADDPSPEVENHLKASRRWGIAAGVSELALVISSIVVGGAITTNPTDAQVSTLKWSGPVAVVSLGALIMAIINMNSNIQEALDIHN